MQIVSNILSCLKCVTFKVKQQYLPFGQLFGQIGLLFTLVPLNVTMRKCANYCHWINKCLINELARNKWSEILLVRRAKIGQLE